MILVRKCCGDGIDLVFTNGGDTPQDVTHVHTSELRTFFEEIRAGKWDHLTETPGAGGPH